MKNIRAFSLLELVFALLAFSIILITVLQLQSSSRKRLALSANSFAAIHLSAKVMSDLIEEARLNPDFLEMLQTFPDMLSKDKVTDAQSCYFRYGCDRQPPWGRFNLADGGCIDKADGVLYKHMSPFSVQVVANRNIVTNASDPERHLAEVFIETSWQEKDGKLRAYRSHINLCSPQGPVPTEGLLLDEEALESLILALLFPDLSGGSLDKAATENGCDRELAYHIGKICVCADAVTTALGNTTREITKLEKQRQLLLTKPDAQLVRIQLKIARAEESGASLLYNVLNDLLPSFQAIDDVEGNRLAAIPYQAYAKGLKTWESLSGQILAWADRAGNSYEWLLQDGLVLPISFRQRDFARNKVLEVYRLRRALGCAAITTIASFLAREKERVTGRNPFQEKFFIREEQLMENSDKLRTTFPNLNSIATTIKNRIEPLANSVPELLQKHPQAGNHQ